MIIQPGARVWIPGASREGQTTLLAALSGLWPYDTEKISLPGHAMLLLPQLPHVFAEGVAAACYLVDLARTALLCSATDWASRH